MPGIFGNNQDHSNTPLTSSAHRGDWTRCVGKNEQKRKLGETSNPSCNSARDVVWRSFPSVEKQINFCENHFAFLLFFCVFKVCSLFLVPTAIPGKFSRKLLFKWTRSSPGESVSVSTWPRFYQCLNFCFPVLEIPTHLAHLVTNMVRSFAHQ